jgi:hypothetical protein
LCRDVLGTSCAAANRKQLFSWAREINSGIEAVTCYVSIERCQQLPEPECCVFKIYLSLDKVKLYRKTVKNTQFLRLLAVFL